MSKLGNNRVLWDCTSRTWGQRLYRVVAMSGAIACLGGEVALAQIAPDATLPVNSAVTRQGDIWEITGGTQAGGNLFHSFEQFSIPTDGTAFFNNALDIQNIFSRVTGVSISNIDGVIRANGTANLFLLNRNGIVFGPNAQLDIGGDFFGSTAHSLRFSDGASFGVAGSQAEPLLTISRPIGLQFDRPSAGSIVYEARGSDEVAGLQVSAGNTLALVGGDVSLDGGTLLAPGGRVELGGLSEAGTVELNEDGSLSFPNDVGRADVLVTNQSVVDTLADNGGTIGINARNIEVSEESIILAGIGSQGSADSQAGDIILNATVNIAVINNSAVSNIVESDAPVGNGGNVYIEAESLALNNSVIGTRGSSVNLGNLTVKTAETVSVVDSLLRTQTSGAGNAGNLTIETNSLIIRDGGEVSVITFDAGNGGNLRVQTESVFLSNGGELGSLAFGTGDAGDLKITATDSINIVNNSFLASQTRGSGNAGNLTIETGSLSVRDGGSVSATTFDTGNAGNIIIRASDIVEAIGGNIGAGTNSDSINSGNGGTLTIETRQLIITDGAQINVSTFGPGDSGELIVKASESVEVIGESFDGQGSLLAASTESGSTGNGGGLTIETGRVIVEGGGQITVSTFGSGKAGDLIVTSESIELVGISALGPFPSGLFAASEIGATGDGGTIRIDTERLLVQDNAAIQATTFGEGNAGDLIVRAREIELSGIITGLLTSVDEGATGDGGNITIETERLLVRDGAQILAVTFGNGNAGELIVNASESIEINGESANRRTALSTSVRSESNSGNGGKLKIETQRLLVINGGLISTETLSIGKAGDLIIDASEIKVIGTSMDMESQFISSLLARSNASGNAGDLIITTENLTIGDGAVVSVSGEAEGDPGDIEITASSIRLDAGNITAETRADRGNIILDSRDLILRNNSQITTNATGEGTGGNITVDSDVIAALENSDITTNAEGLGGLIRINTQGRFGFQVRSREELQRLFGTEDLTVDSPNQLSTSDITAFSVQSPDLNGQVQFNDPDIDPSRGLIELPAEIVDVAEPAQGCRVTGEPGTSELFNTGRGGLPPDPSQTIDSDPTWDDIRDLSSVRREPAEVVNSGEPVYQNSRRVIREAQGLSWAPNGDIIFTAPSENATSYQPLRHLDGCLPLERTKSRSPKTSTARKIPVKRFQFIGNTVISDEQLAEVTKAFTDKLLTFSEVRSVAEGVAELYIKEGYITSGAVIPPHTSSNGVVTVEVVEGILEEEISVVTSGRLHPNYIRKRIGLDPGQPVNEKHLKKALQLLQLDPLISKISAELSAGLSPDTSLLEVNVTEAPSFTSLLTFDNGRSPSVGSFRRGMRTSQANLLGLGDKLSLEYSNSDGSDAWDISYALPVNSSNGTIGFRYSTGTSDVVEPPFDRVDISADSRTYELTYRQPIARTVSDTEVQELAIGLRASHGESQTSLLGENFPLSVGADDNGETKVSAFRFFQDWTQRRDRSVLAVRSEFSLGVGLFDATVNDDEPDSQFFTWRGQGLWARLLAPDTKLLVRGDIQLSTGSLLPLEQLGIGGKGSVRGYRQDTLLLDNGIVLSAELQFPIFRSPRRQTVVQLVPFIDLGAGWNSDGKANPATNVLLSTGVGLQFRLNKRLTARLDWGIPLIDTNGRDRTWQENGLHFSLELNPF